jgi:hypothetical protein
MCTYIYIYIYIYTYTYIYILYLYLQANSDHARESDDSHVASVTHNFGFVQRKNKIILGNLFIMSNHTL